MLKSIVVLASLANLILIASGIDCENDPNAEPGCGNSCVTCANYYNGYPCVTDDICSENSCNCITDYILDENTDTCVLPEDCSPQVVYYGDVPIYNTEQVTCSNDDSVLQFRKAVIEYNSKFLKNIIEDNPGESVHGGAIPTLLILALLALYSNGETESQLLTALNLENKDQIRCALTQINNVLTTDQDNLLTIQGTNIFGNIKYTFTDDFTQDIANLLSGQALNVDFSQQKSAADFIKNVVKDETNGQITDIVSGDEFDKDIQLAPISGYVFTGQLKLPFDLGNTVTGPFFEATKTVEVEYVYQQEVYRYGDSKQLKAKVLELPSKSIYKTYIFFPNLNTDLNSLIEKLGKDEVLDSVIDGLKPTLVKLNFPIFDEFITTIDEFGIAQKNLDISTIFDKDTAQFENIVVNNRDVSISYSTQQFLFQSERDQEPAAQSDEQDLPDVDLKLNRPFVVLVTIEVDSKVVPVVCGYRASANN